MAHQEFGVRQLERIRGDLEAHAVVEQFPKMEGRQLVMVMSPKKGGAKPAVKSTPKPAGEGQSAAKASTPVAGVAAAKAPVPAPQAAGVAAVAVAEKK